MYLGEDISDLGDIDPRILREWSATVRRNGGVVTRWPFDEDDYVGELASRFPYATYARMVYGGKLNPGSITAAQTDNRRFVYVLAPPALLSPRFVQVPLGDDNLGDVYSDWDSQVRALGGTATTWPFSTGIYGKYHGLSAARFTGVQYATLGNAGKIDVTAPAQATTNNQYIYVLAPDSVQQASPKTMSLWQRIQNAVFTGGDTAATAIGLPSLSGIENTLKGLGGVALLALVVGGAVMFGRRGR